MTAKLRAGLIGLGADSDARVQGRRQEMVDHVEALFAAGIVHRREYFAHAFRPRGMTPNEHRHIGAQLQSQRCQFIHRQPTSPQLIERDQGRGRI